MPPRAILPLPHLEGVTHRQVQAGDVELHLAEAGSGPPVLLVHGWPQHWWSWRKVIPELARTHRVICPDLRGHGWSQAPRGSYAKATLAADLIALLDVLELEQVPYVGHDWGGWIGFELARLAPERLTALLALSIPPPWFPARRSPETALFASYQLLLSTPLLGQAVLRNVPVFVERLIRAGASRQEAFETSDLHLYSDPLRDPDHAAATTALYRTFLTRELTRGGALRPPATFAYRLMMGRRDPIRRAVRIGAQDAQLVEGVGHFLPEEAPEVILEALASGILA
ncbi:MAG: alpha/beta fold hydrolase [Solirubrobacterales bacterium]|nr:alpha/beta fold hydrolase [Solirubrobacterales bacterium]